MQIVPLDTMIQGKLEKIFNSLGNMVNTAIDNVTKTPESINEEMWDTVTKMGATVIMPFALTFMCMFFALELYNLYCRTDGKLDMEVVSGTFVKLVLPMLLISRVYSLIGLIFNTFANTLVEMKKFIEVNDLTGYEDQMNKILTESDSISGFWERIGFYLELFPLEFLINLASIVIIVVMYGRLAEIMIYWIFSPIPFSTLVHHEFSSIGKDFLKRFCALSFQGAIIFFGVVIFSVLLHNINMEDGMGAAWSMLGYAILLIFIVIKSSNFSNKLFGAT